MENISGTSGSLENLEVTSNPTAGGFAYCRRLPPAVTLRNAGGRTWPEVLPEVEAGVRGLCWRDLRSHRQHRPPPAGATARWRSPTLTRAMWAPASASGSKRTVEITDAHQGDVGTGRRQHEPTARWRSPTLTRAMWAPAAASGAKTFILCRYFVYSEMMPYSIRVSGGSLSPPHHT